MERSYEVPSGGAGVRSAPARLMTPGDVARLFGVDPKTVARWADASRLPAMRTLGGHRRYRPTDVYALLETEGGTLSDD